MRSLASVGVHPMSMVPETVSHAGCCTVLGVRRHSCTDEYALMDALDRILAGCGHVGHVQARASMPLRASRHAR